MTDHHEHSDQRALRCDCGYRCRGATLEDQARDGQRHAREAHGIDVGADQVIAGGGS